MFSLNTLTFAKRGKGVKGEYFTAQVIGTADNLDKVDTDNGVLEVARGLKYSELPEIGADNVSELFSFANEHSVNIAECFAIGFDILSRRMDKESDSERLIAMLAKAGITTDDSSKAKAFVSTIRNMVKTGLFTEEAAIAAIASSKK